MRTLNVSTIELAREVLRHPAFAQALYEDGADAMRGSLLTLHGSEHQARREIGAAYFDGAACAAVVKKDLPLFINAAISACEMQGTNDAVYLARYFSTCLAAKIVGVELDPGKREEVMRLWSLVSSFVEGAAIVHSRRDHEEVLAEVDEAFAEFDKYYFRPAKSRCKSKGVSWADSILQRNLDQQQKLKMLDEQLMREIAFYMHSASAPLARSIVNVLHESLMWLGAESALRNDLVKNRNLLAGVIHEGLRLHPASPVAWRRAIEAVRLSNGEWLDRGDYVIIDINQVNSDPDAYGEDARSFNPQRAIPRNDDASGLTLGDGIHACPARTIVLGEGAQHGIIESLISILLRKGIAQDSACPAMPDNRTERLQWRTYPILFDPKLKV